MKSGVLSPNKGQDSDAFQTHGTGEWKSGRETNEF